MTVVLFTSTSLRHKYLAHCLAGAFEVGLIISEGKSKKIEETSDLSEEDARFISAHFQRREESEREFFGAYSEFPAEVPLLELPYGGINSPEISDLVENMTPDLIVLFGSSILRSSLMQTYRDRIINLHLGLSPYYTGSATNLFPYYYEEPECIGASIHLASEKVDEGAILHQLRPEMEENDDLHQIGNKVIKKAGKQLSGVLGSYFRKQLTPQPQLPPGRICRNSDLTPALLREIYHKFDQGLIRDYLQDRETRNAGKPIVEADLKTYTPLPPEKN